MVGHSLSLLRVAADEQGLVGQVVPTPLLARYWASTTLENLFQSITH